MPSELRKLLALAWPVVLARASQALGGFCDALMIAPLGEAALAAVTTGWLNVYVATILPSATVYILQSFTAQLRGRGEVDAVHRYAWYGLIIALGFQVLALALLPWLPAALAAAPFEPLVRDHLSVYLSIRLLSIAPIVAVEALASWYGGLGHTRPALAAGAATLAVSVLGNWLLIEPRLGLPGYGVAGAAWASVLGTLAGLASIGVPFALGHAAPPRPARLGLRARELARVVRLGLPHGVSWFMEVLSFLLFVDFAIAQLGTTALAAFNVATQLNSLAYLPALGLALAGAILAGQAIGRRAFDAARRVTSLTLCATCGWMAAIALVYLVAPEPLLRAFAGPDGTTLAFIGAGAVMLRLFALGQIFDGVGLVLNQVLRAAGDTTWCMLVRGLITWLVFVPGAWLLVVERGGGTVTAMLVLLGYTTLMALAVVVRFAAGRWQELELVVDADPELPSTPFQPLGADSQSQRL